MKLTRSTSPGPRVTRFLRAPRAMTLIAHLTALGSALGAVLFAGIMPHLDGVVALFATMSIVAAGFATCDHLKLRAAHRKLERARHAAQTQVETDPLTGLLSRAAFASEFDEMAAKGIASVIVLFFDLDRFKDVNDTRGHKVGDQLLFAVGERTRAILGPRALIARLGGDEFAAVLANTGEIAPQCHGEAIVRGMREPFDLEGTRVSIGTSVGIAVGDLRTDSAETLLRHADLAMYEVKGAPDGACRVFDNVLDGRQTMRSSIRVELGDATIMDQFALAYQPIVDARSGAMTSAEALLRWRSDNMGEVSPATLIPIAEESGHILALTDWTIGAALAAIRRLETIPVGINISPVVFRQPDFTDRLLSRLLAERVRPELVTIEITEGVLIANIEAARSAIQTLRGAGVQVYLDDFGTGYSSLSYLQHFELDGLKIDKSFLQNIGDRRQSTQIVRAVVDFGHSLNMKVVVEGIESEWQMRLLQLLGCDYLQGFEIGVPMTLGDLAEFARTNTGLREASADAEVPRFAAPQLLSEP